MRVERLGGDKVRFFLTMDDLLDRGIESDDMWRDVPKVHDLFNDMMEQAYQELGFEIIGPLAVEVRSMRAQGMVVVVSRSQGKQKEEELDEGGMYELEVTLEESDHIVVRFADFEHLIQLAVRMHSIISEGKVYSFKNQYYLVFEEEQVEDQLDTLIALLLEYGEPSTMSEAYLHEYGKTIWEDHAIDQIVQYFR
jgi:adapter protein MecA 1/2